MLRSKNLVSLVFIWLFLAFYSGSTFGQVISRLDKSAISAKELDQKIEALRKAGNVHGLAIAIFNRNKAVYQKTFGFKNNESKERLTASSNFYGASLSKSVFAVMVMRLVENGLLDLDKPLHEYLSKPIYQYKPSKKWHDNYADLQTDSLYRQITARMCLSHTTGFPNWRWFESDQKLRVKFKPGSRYHYSGEGLVYLQVVLEHFLNTNLEKLMQELVLKPAGMLNSSYLWLPTFEKDYITGHRSDGTLYEKDKDNDARSASTLETTFQDVSLFLECILQKKLLNPGTQKKMFTKQLSIRSVQQMGPLSARDTSANDQLELGYALGWGYLKSPAGFGVFKEGHGDGFQHYCILFPEVGKGVLIMTNSDNGEGIFKALLDLTIKDVYTPWFWQNYIPYSMLKK